MSGKRQMYQDKSDMHGGATHLNQGDYRYVNREELIRLGDSTDGKGELISASRKEKEAAGKKAWSQLLGPDARFDNWNIRRVISQTIRLVINDLRLSLQYHDHHRICLPILVSRRYGRLLRSRPLAYLVDPGAIGGEGAGDCSLLLVHAGAFTWMIDAVDQIAKQVGDGENLPSRYIDIWNLAVALGLDGCSGQCPHIGSMGAELSGVFKSLCLMDHCIII